MSAELSRAILRLDIPLSPRTVLQFLADCAVADDAPRFPKRSTIATALHITERTVKHALNYLQLAGLIYPTNGRKGGRGVATSWLIDLERVFTGRLEPVPVIRKRGKQKGETKGETGANVSPFMAPEKGEKCALPIDTESSIQESEAHASDRGRRPPSPAAPAEVQLDLDDACDALAPTKPAKRATRWPAGQAVPEEWIAQGYGIRRQRGLPDIDLHLEAENFADYWTAKSGKDATKLDWEATWRKWVRSARDGGKGHGKQHRSSKSDLFRGLAGAYGDVEPGTDGSDGGYRFAAASAWRG
jgi:hypothetical protein